MILNTPRAFAQGYSSFALGPPEIAKPEGTGWVAAAGALWSTPSDIAKWDLALMDGKLLKSESFKLMTTPRVLAGGRTTDYGCGLAISVRNGVTVLTHSGMVSGFNANNSMIPSTRSAVVMLSNSEFLIGPLHSKILIADDKAGGGPTEDRRAVSRGRSGGISSCDCRGEKLIGSS